MKTYIQAIINIFWVKSTYRINILNSIFWGSQKGEKFKNEYEIKSIL